MHLLYASQKIFKKIMQIYGLFLNLPSFLLNFIFSTAFSLSDNIFCVSSLV
jgi:hypothetical protein